MRTLCVLVCLVMGCVGSVPSDPPPSVPSAGPSVDDVVPAMAGVDGGGADLPEVRSHPVPDHVAPRAVPAPSDQSTSHDRALLVIVDRPSQSSGHRESGTASGRASWYDDGPGLYAAVHSYRWGNARYSVRVCLRDRPERCVTVTVRDHCQCYVGESRERVIDLSPAAFRTLAPLSTGILWVTVR